MKSVLLTLARDNRVKIEYFDSSDHSAWPARNPSLCIHSETIEYNLKHWLPAAQISILPQEEIIWESK